MTFRLQVKHGTVKYLQPKSESKLIVDWDSFLHFYWLEKMAGSNSTFYDDAKVSHGNGSPVVVIPVYGAVI